MGKDEKRASKSKRAKKTDVKDLAVKDAAAVKGGNRSLNEVVITKDLDKSTPAL